MCANEDYAAACKREKFAYSQTQSQLWEGQTPANTLDKTSNKCIRFYNDGSCTAQGVDACIFEKSP